ncbi:trypsin-1-like [Phlebotomus argentipes]|uniref:trypsin-1-like n=1 Tax=Phlebotomus argentipes TaxID=94469 RepID=UPI002892A6D2|nr:trypsin-1-like [Phlebotomus argentipes]
MKTLVVLSTLLAAALAVPTLPLSSVGSGRIVGGVDALPGEFPQICSLQWVLLTASTHMCGEAKWSLVASCTRTPTNNKNTYSLSIINNNWVLTAAHCLTESPNIGRLEVLCGKLNLAITEPNQARVGIANQVIHDEWVAGGVGPYDIALIRLSAPLIYNPWIQPVTLPTPGTHPTGAATIIGWGNTATGQIPNNPDILQKAPVPIIAYAQCRAALEALNAGHVFSDDKICTGPLTGGISACSGDSGSPVLQGNTQVGIVSWGFIPCGGAGAPSVHMRVSHFIGWINTIIAN